MKTEKTADAGFSGVPVCGAFLMPHPPVIVPEVGGGRDDSARATVAACREVGRRVAELKPETIVVISPHAPLFADYLFVYEKSALSGSFRRFGAARPELSCRGNVAFARAFYRLLNAEGIPGGSLDGPAMFRAGIEDRLDHGVLVPLYFLLEAWKDFNLVALSSSAFDKDTVYRAGALIARAALETGSRICIIASGDMSHKVSSESPYGMAPEGAEFDGEICRLLASSDFTALLGIDPGLRDAAAECGYNSLVMLAGALGIGSPDSAGNTGASAGNIVAAAGTGTEVDTDKTPADGSTVRSRLLSYEAPFGIGYCVAEFMTGGPSVPVRIARETIGQFVRTGAMPDPDGFEQPEGGRAGCFVSIKKRGELRGCIGTIAPVTGSLAEEIVRNAVCACSEDPRFDAVRPEELADLVISVDVLSPAEAVESKDSLDPSKYGVIVTSGYRRGLLLPSLEGVNAVDEQLAIACRKGGIAPDEDYAIERFTVRRYY